jgi:hypothetical protein
VNTFARVCSSVAALSLLVPSAAAAQERRNPFVELFGRAPERQGDEFTSIDFRTTTGVQLGQTLEKDFNPSEGDVPEGYAGGADAQLALQHVRDRIQAQAHARYAYQEYRQEPAFGVPGYEAGGQMVAKATSRLSFDAGGRFISSPFFHLMDPAPMQFGQVLVPGNPFIAWLIDNQSVEGTAGVTANYTKRSSISAWGLWRGTTFAASPDNNFSSRGFRSQWKRRMSRDLSVRAGYGRDEVRQRQFGNERLMNELLDVGVDYSQALPIARRTTLAFATTTSVLRENSGKRHYRLNGGIDLQHGFQRSWRAFLGAHRATQFLPGFAQPLFSDRVRAGVSGYLSKRFIFYGNVDGGQGELGFAETGKFFTYAGDARLTFAASRHFGLFGQYVYYHYQLPPNADSVVQLPRLSRQTFSIGIQTWVPLVNKEKVTTSDPR